MRDIKFRAWHKAEKVMCEVSVINIESGAFLIGVKPGEDQLYDKEVVIAPEDGRFCNWDEIEMLEYTGLMDKNGVEVFEGDLLSPEITYQVPERKGCSYVQTDDNDNLTFYKIENLPCVVRSYVDGGYEMYNKEHDKNAPFWINHRDISNGLEVIGNIHQNPELI